MRAMKYRKKPVVIEAITVNEALWFAAHDFQGMPGWLIDAYEGRNDAVTAIVFRSDGVSIGTLEGKMLGLPGDWIIRGVQGELYPCKPDIFKATYELVPLEEQADD